jgi:hypothetical protein
MFRWLCAHPTGWFFAVLGVWCVSMCVITLLSSWLRRKADDDDADPPGVG